jgi:HSP20 family protein
MPNKIESAARSLPVPRRDAARPQQSWHTLSSRTDPWAELENLNHWMGYLLRGGLAPSPGASPDERWAPPLDLEETEDAYVAEIDMPGVKKQDITVELIGDEVYVHGEVKERERKGLIRRQTRRVGAFDYAFTLPGEIDRDQISASLDDGVLTIRAHKSGPTRRPRVNIPVS